MPLSIALPFRAVLWPLIGAATILTLGRLVPNWLRRLAAASFAMLSLLTLSSLRSVEPARAEIPWRPINLFRASPTLYPDSLSLAAGIVLAGVAVALVLGIRSRQPKSAWYPLVLVALAGSLTAMLAANLLTLALGSALLDLALIAIVLWGRGGEEPGSLTLAVAVPGVASTSLLFFTALWLDASAGHTSLWARNLPAQTLQFVGIAAVLRMLIFPLHPRQLNAPQDAAAVLLPVGTGIYLVARVQALSPLLAETQGLMALGMLAVIAGGLLVWAGGLIASAQEEDGAGIARLWSAGLVYQTGYAAVLALLFPRAALWPILCLPVASGALVIWWDAGLTRDEGARTGWLGQAWHSTAPQRARLNARVMERLPGLERWRSSTSMRSLLALLPAIALASIAGAPMTAGFHLRWPLYAALLKQGSPNLLLMFVADVFVLAGFWLVLGPTLRRADRRRNAPAAILAAGLLALALIVAGMVRDGFQLRPVLPAGVSVWGSGLLFVLPWLFGAWVARWGSHLADYAPVLQAAVRLDWLYRAASWVGERLVGLFYWLGQVGEGDGWWGWALIILALGAVFLAAR
jgi:formate hydrogenlyase subunit 3/multisubunit Na+/H+ antiporter MnhD subunit